MNDYLKFLKSKKWVFRISTLVLTGLGLMLSLLPTRIFIPSLQDPSLGMILIILMAAALTALSLVTLNLLDIRKAFLESIGYSFIWLFYTVVFIGLPSIVVIVGMEFPADQKSSIQLEKNQIHIYETSCFLESGFDCDDYKTEFYRQRPNWPIMTRVANCPCYFENPVTKQNDTLELASTSCTDQTSKVLLFDIKTGKLEQNECV